MNSRLIICVVFFTICTACFSQNKIDLKASFDLDNKQISISQTIHYHNTSNDELGVIYLNNWANSYATKKTPLAIRIADEFNNNFHLAKNEERGYSIVTSIKQGNIDLVFEPLKNQIDVLEVKLSDPIKPNATYKIQLEFILSIRPRRLPSRSVTTPT